MENKKINWDKILNYAYYFLLIVLIIWLIYFRTDVWLHRAGFFYDEAFLLKNIQEKSFLELFKTLDYIQCCPAFFLITNKLIYNLFGLNDIFLCIIPYLSGIFSIILIPFISNKIFNSKLFSFLFLILFAYHPHLTLGSQTFKQYSSDVFFALLIIYLFLSFKDKIKTQKHFFCTGILCGLFCFFSFTSQFIIFPIFLYYLLKSIKEKTIHLIIAMTIPYLSILGFEYFLISGTYDNGMREYWENIFPIYTTTNDFIYSIAQFVIHKINDKFIFLFFLIGIVSLAIKDKLLLYILTAPIILNIFAQLINAYPFPIAESNRVVIYIAPLAMIICLKTLELLTNIIKKQKIYNFIIFLVFILVFNTNLNGHYIQEKKLKNDNYYFINSNSREYVNNLEKYNFNSKDIIIGIEKEHISFDIYSNYKYKNNSIFIDEDFGILDNSPTGQFFWFYNGNYSLESKKWTSNVNEWINKNCEIIIREKDDMGELFYVKKIK